MMADVPHIKGRGAQFNPSNRFLKHSVVKDPEQLATEEEREELLTENPRTRHIEVFPKSIINKVESPDLPDWSMNPYQGCEHGCVYCYARNSHEYWGYSAGADFESTILVKKNAPDLLAKKLADPKWKAAMIMLAGNTDIYQPAERKYGLTRAILEMFYKYRHPVGLITKNALILRDIDILEKLAAENLVVVNMSLTTMDESLKRLLEPRTSSAARVLNAVKELSSRGIPVRIMNAPVIPSLNDFEITSIAKAAAEAGAIGMSYIMVRLNGQVASIFEDWIRKTFPDRAERVLNQIRSSHGGTLNESRFGIRMRGEGNWAEIIQKQHQIALRKYFPGKTTADLNYDLHRQFKGGQLSLF